MHSQLSLPTGVIFDMDGVLVDSNPYHLEKWVQFLKENGISFNVEDLPNQILGQRNDVALRHFFGSQLSQQDVFQLGEQLEEEFRKVFQPHVKPLPGLEPLVLELHHSHIPMAVASSAIAKNVEFVVERLGFHRYFRHLVSGDEVSHPKPDPEIYLKTAAKMGLNPPLCVAFEDSPVGVESAKRAGMKCVGIASSFPLEELASRADLAVPTFEPLNLERLRELFH